MMKNVFFERILHASASSAPDSEFFLRWDNQSAHIVRNCQTHFSSHWFLLRDAYA